MRACGETCLRAGGCYRRVGHRGMSECGKDGLLYKNSVAGGAISAHCKAYLGAGGGCRRVGDLGMSECVNVAIDVRAAAMAGMSCKSTLGAGGRGKLGAIIVPKRGNGSLGY